MIKLKHILEASTIAGVNSTDGEQDTGFLPKGTIRKLGSYNKPDKWFDDGGYTQVDFPVADDIFGKDNDPDFQTIKITTPEKDSLFSKWEEYFEATKDMY